MFIEKSQSYYKILIIFVFILTIQITFKRLAPKQLRSTSNDNTSDTTELPPAFGTSLSLFAASDKLILFIFLKGSNWVITTPLSLLLCTAFLNLNIWLNRTEKFTPIYMLHGDGGDLDLRGTTLVVFCMETVPTLQKAGLSLCVYLRPVDGGVKLFPFLQTRLRFRGDWWVNSPFRHLRGDPTVENTPVVFKWCLRFRLRHSQLLVCALCSINSWRWSGALWSARVRHSGSAARVLVTK